MDADASSPMLTPEVVYAKVAEIIPNEETKKEPIPQSELKHVVSWLSHSSPEVRSKAVELVGELARVKKNRKRIGRLSPVRPLLNIVQDQDIQNRKWAARALGNLSYENEKVIKVIVAHGGAPLLIALIKEPDTELQRNSAGALANLASLSQEEEINTALIGGGVLVPAIDLLLSDNEMVQYMATRLLSNLSDNEQNQKEIGKVGGIAALVKLLRSTEYTNVKMEAINALSYLTENVQNCADFSKESALNLFLELLGSDEDEDLQKAAFEQLLALAQKEEIRAEFRHSGVLKELLHMTQGDDKKQKISMAVLAHLTLDEENMVVIFEHVDKLLAFLSSSDGDLQLNSAMVFGNMARNDQHCVKLMSAGCVTPLIEMMSSKDHRVQHLATNAIRNLSIPTDNKRQMVEQGALSPLIKLLTSQNAHVMFAGIGAIKSLMMLPENRTKFVAEGGLEPLIGIKDAVIVDLSSNDDEPEKEQKPKDRRVQLEAGRVLVLLSEEVELRDAIVEKDGFGLIAFMIESPYDILHLEATKGVHNLSEKEGHKAALLQAGILEPLVSLITRAETDKLQLATLHLLQALAADEKCKNALSDTGVLDILDLVAGKETTTKEVVEACHRLKTTLHS